MMRRDASITKTLRPFRSGLSAVTITALDHTPTVSKAHAAIAGK
jgi:hypothetical protein